MASIPCGVRNGQPFFEPMHYARLPNSETGVRFFQGSV